MAYWFLCLIITMVNREETSLLVAMVIPIFHKQYWFLCLDELVSIPPIINYLRAKLIHISVAIYSVGVVQDAGLNIEATGSDAIIGDS
jgi:hypothetical protein